MLTEEPWTERPPRPTVSDLEKIGEISISARNINVMQTILNLSNKYPNYRRIRGDGNCFYRAIFFSLLRRSRLDNFNELFPAYHHIDLTVCRQDSIPQPFRKFYKKDFMIKSWSEGWAELFDETIIRDLTHQQLERYLIQKLNTHWWLDFLLVNYYRCLTYHTIKNNKNFYRQFLPGVATELYKISRYGQQSEGVEIQALGYSIQSHISIHIVNKQGAFPILYECKGAKMTQSLLFRPGHYDVLIQEEKPKKQSKVKFKADIVRMPKSPKNSQPSAQQLKPRPSSKVQLHPPRTILKKSNSGNWKAIDARIVRVSTQRSSLEHVNMRLVMLILLLVLSVFLGLLSVYKSKIMGKNEIKTRTDWHWRPNYLSRLKLKNVT